MYFIHYAIIISIVHSDINLLIIDELAPKSSCGFDGISSKIIEMLKVYLTKPNAKYRYIS